MPSHNGVLREIDLGALGKRAFYSLPTEVEYVRHAGIMPYVLALGLIAALRR